MERDRKGEREREKERERERQRQKENEKKDVEILYTIRIRTFALKFYTSLNLPKYKLGKGKMEKG